MPLEWRFPKGNNGPIFATPITVGQIDLNFASLEVGFHPSYGDQWLNGRLAEIGLPSGTVQTMFEFIDLDEGRLKLGSK